MRRRQRLTCSGSRCASRRLPVKVAITDANEERITHAIFYTAITRARRQLGIYWTPETRQRILTRLAIRENAKDEHLLKARRGVQAVATRPRRQKARQQP